MIVKQYSEQHYANSIYTFTIYSTQFMGDKRSDRTWKWQTPHISEARVSWSVSHLLKQEFEEVKWSFPLNTPTVCGKVDDDLRWYYEWCGYALPARRAMMILCERLVGFLTANRPGRGCWPPKILWTWEKYWQANIQVLYTATSVSFLYYFSSSIFLVVMFYYQIS